LLIKQEDLISKFSDEKFKSKLNRFFVSADGHFAAVQGIYDDAKTMSTPMVILIEVKDGKIIKQYDYLVYVEIF
jgi:ketosteroid isomerase-like protein